MDTGKVVLVGKRLPLCADYRYNRSTWFSGRLRYDFVLGASMFSTCTAPYLIEVHGEQHYRADYNGNDWEKEELARKYGCPLLVIPYYWANEYPWSLLFLISTFVESKGRAFGRW